MNFVSLAIPSHGCLHVSLSYNGGGTGQAEAELGFESQEIRVQILAQLPALWVTLGSLSCEHVHFPTCKIRI